MDLIQLREKDLACRDMLAMAKSAVEVGRRTNTRIVVNDRLDMAIAAGAHGVHLGGQSAPPEAVRRHVDQDFLVGVSCHSMEEALKAEAGGADYILLGPVFDTPSKRPYGPPLGLSKLSEVANRFRIPVLAWAASRLRRSGRASRLAQRALRVSDCSRMDLRPPIEFTNCATSFADGQSIPALAERIRRSLS